MSTGVGNAIRQQRVLIASYIEDDKILRAPVFILGAPRSGTTLLGSMLGYCPDALYLNEPKWLWARIFPYWDSYGAVADANGASIRLAGIAVEEWQKRRIRSAFSYMLRIGCRKLLIEKTPDNSARVPWLTTLFPDARFIHILRDPHDAATSLNKALNKWFPSGWTKTPQYKVWDRHCGTRPEVAQMWLRCCDNYQRGLVVWRVLNEYAWRDGSDLGAERYQRLKYEDLVANPEKVTTELYQFLHIKHGTMPMNIANGSISSASVGKPGRNSTLVSDIVGSELLGEFAY